MRTLRVPPEAAPPSIGPARPPRPRPCRLTRMEDSNSRPAGGTIPRLSGRVILLARPQSSGGRVRRGVPQSPLEESVAPAGGSGHRMPFEVHPDLARCLPDLLSVEASHASVVHVMNGPGDLEPWV